jgi:hypothetical protein
VPFIDAEDIAAGRDTRRRGGRRFGNRAQRMRAPGDDVRRVREPGGQRMETLMSDAAAA